MELSHAFDVLKHVTVDVERARRKPLPARPVTRHIKRYGGSVSTQSTVIRRRGIDPVQQAVETILSEANLKKISSQIAQLMSNNKKEFETFFNLFKGLASRVGELSKKAEEHKRISEAYSKSINALYDVINGIRREFGNGSANGFEAMRFEGICKQELGLRDLSKTS